MIDLDSESDEEMIIEKRSDKKKYVYDKKAQRRIKTKIVALKDIRKKLKILHNIL